jgi:hypothetical protein
MNYLTPNPDLGETFLADQANGICAKSELQDVVSAFDRAHAEGFRAGQAALKLAAAAARLPIDDNSVLDVYQRGGLEGLFED